MTGHEKKEANLSREDRGRHVTRNLSDGAKKKTKREKPPKPKKKKKSPQKQRPGNPDKTDLKADLPAVTPSTSSQRLVSFHLHPSLSHVKAAGGIDQTHIRTQTLQPGEMKRVKKMKRRQRMSSERINPTTAAAAAAPAREELPVARCLEAPHYAGTLPPC